MSSNIFNPEPDDSDEQKKNGKPKFSAIYYVMAILVLIGIQLTFFLSNTTPEKSYSEFHKLIEEDKIDAVKISPTRIYALLKPGTAEVEEIRRDKQNQPFSFFRSKGNNREFFVVAVKDNNLIERLEEKKIRYQGIQDGNWFTDLVQWVFPFAILLGIYFFVFRRMNPGSQVMNIAKNKAELYEEDDDTKVTFADVAGLNEAKEEVMEVVDFLKDPKRFTKLGGKLPKGVLLVGPPGTGKTLLAKAVAGEAGAPFFSISGSDFVEMFVGVGAARVRDLFKQAKEKAPCIIFIDEIDAVGRSRGKGMMMGINDERENTLNQLLVEMDGFATDKGVIMMAATNRPDVLDSALLRPGRFDRQVMVDKPDLNGRIEIFKVHTKNIPLGKDVDLKVLSSQTPGFAGADIANIANEAALLASRRGKEAVEMIDFQDAIERVIAGLEKKNKVINPKEKRIVAYHESGHAIIGWLLPTNDTVQKVSIVPRGVSALGYTINMPLEDRYLMTKDELIERICALLGGRVAEEIVFGKISTGAQNDLERVTEIAYSMVSVYGMSEKLGYISYLDSSNPYLGGPGIDKKYGEETARIIDEEVAAIIREAHHKTREILMENRDKLEKMANDLLKREVLNYKDIEEILGKRANLDDGVWHPGQTQETEGAEITPEANLELSEPDTSKLNPDLSEDERKSLEEAVEKIKASRQNQKN
ncbi:ATP-dependent metalloprotease FtsH [Chloroherpeton thalassium ATCC 35110]|uniref:ATP-dependent zinc metalloprotease FtsH n=1 Tax=Chloroherpeton thalassium (strain ATCC 35110 / GB-78) TaxID=517418 RepID=B3QZD4_CHLT3|nr:ATP-dependent zinc metalloprotease FtsH [Chloroherpeton thalassium]ACF13827.1 ATP-dependent metalloprotease FtsH [Chloroherpeton thalassium ATCC 35110]